MADPAVVERFMAKVIPEPNSGCWLWTGALHTSGYGHFGVGGRPVKAHRLSYEMHNGPIEDVAGQDGRGACVIHSCDVRSCVNPAHLRLGSHADNMLDKAERKRVVSHPLLGERHQNSKLTSEKVRRIRAMASTGARRADIAEKMGVRPVTVGDVLRGRTWSHVE